MNFSKLTLAASTAALALVLSACSQNHSDNSLGYDGSPDNSCQFSADDGDSATPQRTRYEATYFGKTFDRGVWKAISQASIRNTSRFVEEHLNADVYQSHVSGRGRCQPLGYLPQASGAALDFWSQVTSNVKTGASLLGLYVPPPQGGVTRHTVMVAPDTVRWTLVHEMTHHLFEMYRESRPGFLDNQELDAQLRDAYNNSATVCSSQQGCDYGALARVYNRFVKLLDEKLMRFSLEEVTIEANLSKAYQSGFFGYMTDERRNSIKYLESNAKSVKNTYTDVAAKLAQVRDNTDSSALVEAYDLLQNRIAEVDSVIAEIEAVDGKPLSDLKSHQKSRLVDDFEPVALCHHSGDEEALEMGKAFAKSKLK